MKILIINTFYYPTFIGGAEISVQLLAENLVKEGNRVFIFCNGPQNRVYRVNNVIVISCKQRNLFTNYGGAGATKLSKILWHLIDSCNPFYHFKLLSILKKKKPQVVHTNNIQGFSPFVWLTVKSTKTPLVHTIRDYYLLCHKSNMFNNNKNCTRLCTECKITNSIKSRFINYPNHFIGISKYITTVHADFFPTRKRNFSVVYNAAAANKFPVTHSESEIVVFGYIGRIEKDKGVEYLANELANLNADNKLSFKILFAGKGEDIFITQLKEKLAGTHFEFLGVVQPADFFSKIDVLLVPALWNEPFGRTVIEALSFSIPVCHTDRGGLKELYDPECAWMFTPEKGNLSKIISDIVENKAELSSKKALLMNKLQNRFSTTNYINNYLSVYKRAIGGEEITSQAILTE
ncbi:glycosyltransferase [Pedobacter sp. HMF7647]|uniref:Glycosyltransferase n=1 Tax=Hufsiella arboris TaxID=2695275 RepID=A0A7K1YAB4_9SPHI|nr:glycosyltransferase [Hufsiella arboris]MXV51311.1 glycosyltransferase [Hufsiella arboris]